MASPLHSTASAVPNSWVAGSTEADELLVAKNPFLQKECLLLRLPPTQPSPRVRGEARRPTTQRGGRRRRRRAGAVERSGERGRDVGERSTTSMAESSAQRLC